MKGIVRRHTIPEVTCMDKEKQEKLEQKKEKEVFGSVTRSVKPENQNQEHNVRKEGVGRQNNKYKNNK